MIEHVRKHVPGKHMLEDVTGLPEPPSYVVSFAPAFISLTLITCSGCVRPAVPKPSRGIQCPEERGSHSSTGHSSREGRQGGSSRRSSRKSMTGHLQVLPCTSRQSLAGCLHLPPATCHHNHIRGLEMDLRETANYGNRYFILNQEVIFRKAAF